MKPIKLSTGRTINALAAGLLAAVLSACGSADSDSVQVTTTTATAAMTAVISLTDVAALQTKTGLIGHSYIDPSKPWVDWSGQPTDISYNNVTRLLTIPAPADGADMVLGVQRYDRFYGSRRYQLAITTSDPQVSALIFLFDKTGRVVPIPGLMGPLYVARDGAPLEFDAPTDAVGFFVQIQSGWQATESATLRPVVVDVGSALGDEFINPRGPWTDWTGEAAPVSYNALINQIWIQATADGVGHNLGVQRITNPLIVGQEYELAVRRGSREGSSLLLFLVNAQGGVMPFFNPDTGDSQLWLAVTATGDGPDTQRFIAPEGVAEMRGSDSESVERHGVVVYHSYPARSNPCYISSMGMGTTAVASISERADSLPAAAALDVFDEWCSLFWSVDESVSILYQNAAASDLISRAVGLERHYGRLKCADPVDQEALIKMISVIPCSDPRASQPQSMRMSRTSRHQGLLVNSRLISVRHPEGDGSVQLCLLTILDREMRGVGPTASQLKQAFGLSRTEAAVAIGISNGVSPAEIAQRRRVTIDTVRAQLRFVYRKTGTSRQAELVRLVLQLAALGTHWAGEQRD